MSNDPVVGADAALGDSAGDQLAHGVTGSRWGHGRGPGSEHAEAHRLVVVSGSVGALAIPAPALVGTAVRAEAPVVADIGPSVGVHVEVLDVAHLGGTGVLGGARSSGGVVDHNEGRWADGQQRGGGGTGTPLGTGDNWGAS